MEAVAATHKTKGQQTTGMYYQLADNNASSFCATLRGIVYDLAIFDRVGLILSLETLLSKHAHKRTWL
jgi:hypothetical protein